MLFANSAYFRRAASFASAVLAVFVTGVSPVPIGKAFASNDLAKGPMARSAAMITSAPLPSAPAGGGSAFSLPSPRTGASMAYDAATSLVVLFGGTDGAGHYFSDTWTWNGKTWKQLSPTQSPPARYGAAMTYIPATQKIMLFGGGAAGALGDTWAWDGINWTQLTPAKSPAARFGAGIAYDAATSSAVLFGGYGDFSDTWTWDGINWTQLAPANAPTGRGGPGMAYDAARGNVVLFGGFGCCTAFGGDIYLSDTWTWSGTNWSKQSPSSSPGWRSFPSMDYEGANGNTVLFGGEMPAGANTTQANDWWTWDGTTWTRRDILGSVGPAAREFAPLTYDPAWGAMVLFGGEGGGSKFIQFGDTWMWNGAWTGLLGATAAGTEAQAGANPSEHATGACTSQPVNCQTFEFWHTFVDLSIPGRGVPIRFTRTYSSFAASKNGPFGYGWTHSYNLSLTLDSFGNATVTQENGSTISFASTPSGYQAPARILASLAKNSDGTFTLTRNNQQHFIFSATGQLVKEADRNGYATTLSYTNGQLSTVADPAGRTLSLTYTNGAITGIVDSANRATSIQYDTSGNLATVTDVNGGLTKFTYDAAHEMLTMIDPNSGVVTNTYSGAGQVSQQVDPLQRATQFGYAGGLSNITDPRGNVTAENFQSNELVSLTKGSGTAQAATWSYSYDPAALGVTSVTDPNQHVSNYSWDANGNLLNATDPLQRVTTYTYDALNDLQSQTDPLKVTTSYTYDANGNLLSSATPLSGTSQTATTTYQYDPAHPGDVLKMTDANGKDWQFAYDQYGDLVKKVDPLGNTTTYVFDSIGRMTSMVSPKGNVTGGNPAAYTTAFASNAFGDWTSVVDPLQHKTSYQHDGDRNLIAFTDANSNITSYTFDLDNELTQIKRADQSSLQNSYDADGNLTSQTDGRRNATTYTYDPLNRRVSASDPLLRKTTFAYDTSGNRTSRVDPLNRTTTYAFDSANELTGISYSDLKTPNVSFTYDADGQRLTMSDGTGTASYQYDSLHRLTKNTNGASQSVGYGYDLVGQLTAITYPGGTQTVSRVYDDARRPQSITDWSLNKTTFSYDPNANLTAESYPNGAVASFSYNAADQLIAISDVVGVNQFLNLSYSRDAIGQVTSETSTAFVYNAINQLAGFGTTGYAYDAADDPSQTTAGSITTTFTYDAANEPGTMTTTNGGVQTQKLQFAYDLDGNRTSKTDQANHVTSYTFDQANRLTGAGSATYAYNGDGLRMSKTVSKAESFAWNLADQLPEVLVDGSTSYVTGPGGGGTLEQVTSKGAVYYFHLDQLGSTRAVTDSKGNVVATYGYDAYGNVTSTTGSLANPFRYAGEFLDSESGYEYLRARYYDPATLQFVQRDPVGSITKEPYAYAYDDPTNLSDPSGLWGGGVCIAGSGSTGGVGVSPMLPIGASLFRQKCLVLTFDSQAGFHLAGTHTYTSKSGTAAPGVAKMVGSPGLGGTVSVEGSGTVKDPCDFGAQFLYGSYSLGAADLFSTGGSAAFGQNAQGQQQAIYDVGAGVGWGPPVSVSASLGTSYTVVSHRDNVIGAILDFAYSPF